jgi:hypothetical protein
MNDIPLYVSAVMSSARYVVLKSHKTYPEYIAGTTNNRRDSLRFMDWLKQENPTCKVRAVGIDEYIAETVKP